MNEKINIRDLIEFEEKILNPEITGNIKYSVDGAIESKVKYDFLEEIYGKKVLDSALEELNIKDTDLGEVLNFSKVKELLEKKY